MIKLKQCNKQTLEEYNALVKPSTWRNPTFPLIGYGYQQKNKIENYGEIRDKFFPVWNIKDRKEGQIILARAYISPCRSISDDMTHIYAIFIAEKGDDGIIQMSYDSYR